MTPKAKVAVLEREAVDQGMSISIPQPALASLLERASSVVDSRPSLPILANLLLAAHDGVLVVQGTNLEMTVVVTGACSVEQAGEIVLPTDILVKNVLTLEKHALVEISVDADTLKATMHCGKAVIKINGMNPDEFPPLKAGEAVFAVSLPAAEFCRAVRSTVYAASKEIHTPVLAGVQLHFGADGLGVMATDTYRVGIEHLPEVETSTVLGSAEIVLPAASFRKVESLFRGSDAPILFARCHSESGGDLVRFEGNGTTVFCQIVDGRSRLSLQLATGETPEQADVEVDAIRRVLVRTRIFSSDNNMRVLLKFTDDSIEIVGASQERGEAFDAIPCKFVGEPFEIQMNLDYLLEALDSFGTKRVSVEHGAQPWSGIPKLRTGWVICGNFTPGEIGGHG